MLLVVKVTKARDLFCWESHWVRLRFPKGVTDRAALTKLNHRSVATHSREDANDQRMCDFVFLVFHQGASHQEAVRLFQARELEAKISGEIMKIPKVNHPLLIRELFSIFRKCYITVGSLSRRLRKGARHPGRAHRELWVLQRERYCITQTLQPQAFSKGQVWEESSGNLS